MQKTEGSHLLAFRKVPEENRKQGASQTSPTETLKLEAAQEKLDLINPDFSQIQKTFKTSEFAKRFAKH